ncbi:MAG: molecular chaperone HtpG, partial [Trebonia sp.]
RLMSVQTEQRESVQAEQETFRFEAEVVQILDLMVHSLYSNKEIFLRELISNASDAIDRLRLELLTSGEGPEDDESPRIRVSYDSGAGTITIADNGIGMSRAEVIEHIGTIAKSGTRDFLRALTGDQRKDATLIGQFGVGFYSAFIVAERVTLITRRHGHPAEEGVRWESDGKGEYTLHQVDSPARGTTIVLQLRETEDDLLNGHRLRSIIQKYSDHISLPIVMPDEETGDSPVNQASALWTRPKSEITEQEYRDFYRHVAADFTDPLAWVHSKVEGTYEYTLLLFIPSRAPYDLWIQQAGRGVKLHIRRVFVMEDNGQLLPTYLRFVRGVIDSGDLPLNVSRELLQSSRVVDHIRVNAVKKVLKLLADLAASEPEKYAAFWAEFGGALKEGMADDFHNRDEIARLLRFHSTKSGGDAADASLGEYVGRMADGQEQIYYLVAPSLSTAAASPQLEAFKQKGIEVLLLGEDVDNWVVSNLREFDGRRLVSVAQGGADVEALLGSGADTDGTKEKEQADAEFAALTGRLKAILAGQAWDVRLSSRLTTSPACIVANEGDINPAVRLRSYGMPAQPVLEINPAHPLIKRLNRDTTDPRLADWAHVLYNQSVLTLGAPVEEPARFVTRLNDLLVSLAGEAGTPAGDGEEGAE